MHVSLPEAFRPVSPEAEPGMQENHTAQEGTEREYHSPRQVKVDQKVFLLAKFSFKVGAYLIE